MKRILCLWLPHWPVQRLVAAHRELSRQPIVLFRHDSQRSALVSDCSPAAQSIGIEMGMPLAEAKSLSSQKRRLIFYPADPQADRAALQQLAESCECFSPIVGLEDHSDPSSLLLEITGLADLFGGERSLAAQIIDHCQRRGYQVCLAIADTLGLSWGVAHRLPSSLETTHLEIVPPHDRQVLSSLPVSFLRLPVPVLQTLGDLGILQTGQLLQLPRADLRSHLGEETLLRLDQASGNREELIKAHQKPPVFQANRALEYPTDDQAVLLHALQQPLQAVCQQLAQHQRGALRLECQLECVGRIDFQLELRLFQPTISADQLMKLLVMQFEQTCLPEQVQAIDLQATLHAPLPHQQLDLFQQPLEGQHELARLVNRLTSRLGPQGVVAAHLRADAQPEYAYRYQSLAGRKRTVLAGKPASDHFHFQPMQRPLYLLQSPVALQNVSVTRKGSPTQFHMDHQSVQVARHWGPERIETGWWRKPFIRRDYYRVETDQGNRFWIFRQLNDGKWFLHGEF